MLEELRRENVAAPYKAVYDKGTFRQAKAQREKICLVSMEDVEEEEITWLYQPYVPRGKVTICAAYPGTGKTFLLCYMAACVSTGRSFFNQVPFTSEPGKVIYLTAEDGIGDTIKKRLRICGANMANISTVLNKCQLMFDSPEIEEYMRDYKPDLMIFDPFQAYIGAEVDMNAPNKTREKLGHISDLAEKYGVSVVLICHFNKNGKGDAITRVLGSTMNAPNKTREKLGHISDLAEKYGVSVVLICHFNKNGKGDAITRVLGSTDIMGICRSYIALGPVPGEDDMKFMSHEKSSLDRRGKTILFEIDPDRGGVVYLGENNLTMDDYAAIRNKKRANNAPAIEAAKMFLTENMPEGRRPAKELMKLAEAMKISEGSLRRAREELGIVSQKEDKFPFRSVWVLPGHIEDEPEAEQQELDLQQG